MSFSKNFSPFKAAPPARALSRFLRRQFGSNGPFAFAGIFSISLLLGVSAAADSQIWRETVEKERTIVPMPSLAPVVDKVGPSVLTITTELDAELSSQRGPMGPFGFQGPQRRAQKGQGSGFLIHPNGYAITNYHVVENSKRISVHIGDGTKEYNAIIVGVDPKTDVALIKVQGNTRFPFVPLADSAAIKVGDFVVAIGNPFGLSMSVSTGIISARSRRDIRPSGRQGLYDFLQTDASINPGNSGGPLVNLAGEVVGINSATNMAGDGIGFAIPINLVKRILPDLKSKGQVVRSWIGVGIQKIDAELAQGLGLDRPRGALITQVVPEGPAAKAGIQPGDVITRFDGKVIGDASELPLIAGHAGVGKYVKIEILRDGRVEKRRITLGTLPDHSERANPYSSKNGHEGKLGIQFEDLSPDVKQKLHLGRDLRGVHVVNVAPGSRAHDAGLRPHDVILSVNRKRVRNSEAFMRAVKKTRSGKLLGLLVKRQGGEVYIGLTKP
ncbi:MAG: Do family serine endopeptidase [Deltaproteobacteria bacterium]|nr:Do family serine endopeptidase [Deltaproteobacteria bacterium]